jgi:hypothetical protein
MNLKIGAGAPTQIQTLEALYAHKKSFGTDPTMLGIKD